MMSNRIEIYGCDYSRAYCDEYLDADNLRLADPLLRLYSDPEEARQLLRFINRSQQSRDYEPNNSLEKAAKYLLTKRASSDNPNDLKWKFQSLAGFFSGRLYDNQQVQPYLFRIGSRFDTIDGKPDEPGKPWFLLKMLEAWDEDFKLDENSIPNSMEELYEQLLVGWFIRCLRKVWLRLGSFRTYRQYERNDSRPCGRIDVNRHIRFNVGYDNGTIAYSYREKTVDNHFNHLVLYAYSQLRRCFPRRVLWQLERNREVRDIVTALMTQASDYGRFSVRTLLLKNRFPISQPYYLPYEELREVCIRIVRHLGISLDSDEDNQNGEGFLFYMPDLWEAYVQRLLEKALAGTEYHLVTQSKHPLVQNRKCNGWLGECRPDYVICDEHQQPIMILDAKYRAGWEDIFVNDNKLTADGLMPDVTKCIRDMHVFNARHCGVVFPMFRATESTWNARKISDKQNSLFLMIPIYVNPQKKDQSYSDWRSDFESAERENIEKHLSVWLKNVLKSQRQ